MREKLLICAIPTIFAGALISAPAIAGETVTYPGDALQLIMNENTLAPSGIYDASGGKSNSLSGNVVTFNSGMANMIIGALNTVDSESVTNNTIIINSGTVDWNIRAGWTSVAGDTTVSGNSVTVNDGTTWVIFGGRSISVSGLATADNNYATVNGGTVQAAFAGRADSNTGNTISIGNELAITGGTILNTVSSGDSVSTSGNAESSSNTTIITGGTITNQAFGAQALSTNGVTTADANVVIMSNGSVGSVVGGQAISQNSTGSITANGNIVEITGGNVAGVIMGGQSGAQFAAGTATASGNIVTLMGGTFGGDIRAGYSFTNAGTNIAQNNTVTIGGTANLSVSNIYGGLGWNGTAFITGNDANVWTGNTLNVRFDGVGNTVAGVYNFENYNFYLPTTMAAGDTMLVVGNTVDITNSKISIGINGGTSVLNVGDTITLMSTAGLIADGINTRTYGLAGIAKIFEFDLSADADNLYAYVASETNNEQTKSLSEGKLGGMSFLNQGADLVAGQGIGSMLAATSNKNGAMGFGAVGGGQSRYNTGSHVDVRGVSLMTGIAKKINSATVGAFIEAGWGNYDSFNSFNAAQSVKGKGDTNYVGIGALGRYDVKNTYGEGSVRIGRVKTDFSSSDFGIGDIGYDSSVMYTGAHAGVGYIAKLDNKSSIDLSTKVLWTYQAGDSVTIAGDNVTFEASNSLRSRTGARYSYNVKPTIAPYAGAYLDYELLGDAKAFVNDTPIATPTINGATGVGEIGLTIKRSDALPLTLDFGVQGYVGTRQGISGSLQIKYEF